MGWGTITYSDVLSEACNCIGYLDCKLSVLLADDVATVEDNVDLRHPMIHSLRRIQQKAAALEEVILYDIIMQSCFRYSCILSYYTTLYVILYYVIFYCTRASLIDDTLLRWLSRATASRAQV